MAPGFYIDNSPMAITQIAHPTQPASNWDRLTHRRACEVKYEQKEETRKEKIARLAKEKMHASWKVRDQREPDKPKVFQLRQICKPRHRVNFIHR